MKRQIILASTSPRRKQLLALLNIKFKAVDSGYEEILHKHLSHFDLVKFLALGKARAAAKKYPNALIIAADTVVSFQGRALGKPKNKKEARLMLSRLSGKSHYVISGAVVLDPKTKQIISGFDKVKVYFRKLSKADINSYLRSGEAIDKAGAYGFLGKGFNLVAKIEGDATTDLGMSMTFVFNALQKIGLKV